MKVGERGQVTIPKPIRERFGIGPDTEVEFLVENNAILLHKKPTRLRLEKWKGRCRQNFEGLGSVDQVIEALRGR